MSLFKNIPMGERYSIQLRLEAFNVFNHPNFNDKNYNVNVNGPWQWTYNTPAGGGSSSPDITVSKARISPPAFPDRAHESRHAAAGGESGQGQRSHD
jgi:hypothetical protein